MRKILSAAVIRLLIASMLIALISPIGTEVYTKENTSITVNGEITQSNPITEYIDDRLYVSISSLSDELGLELFWDEYNKKLSIVDTISNHTLVMVANSNLAIFDDQVIDANTPLIIMQEKSMVDLEFVCNLFGYQKDYFSNTNTYNIIPAISENKTMVIQESEERATFSTAPDKLFSGKLKLPEGHKILTSGGANINVSAYSTRSFTYNGDYTDRDFITVNMPQNASEADYSLYKTNCLSTDSYAIKYEFFTNASPFLGTGYLGENGIVIQNTLAKRFAYTQDTSSIDIDIPYYWDSNINFVINDKYKYNYYTDGVYSNGDDLIIGARTIGEILGASVMWDWQNNIMSLRLNNIDITLIAGEQNAVLNHLGGQTIQLSYTPNLKYGSLFMSLKELCHLLQYDCLINQERGTIYLNTKKYDLYVEDTKISLDYPLTFNGENLLCGLKPIVENMGITVSWNEDTKQITLEKGSDKMVMVIGSNQYTLNSVQKIIDIPAQYINSIVHVPIKLISECFGYKFDIDHNNTNVFVYSDEQIPSIEPFVSMMDNEYIKNPDSNIDLLGRIKFNANTLISIKNGSYVLQSPSDYSINDNIITFSREYIRTLPAGLATITFYFSNGFEVNITISIKDEVYIFQNSIFGLYVDGYKTYTEIPLCTVKGQYYVPVRSFAENLGCSVELEDQRVIITDLYKNIIMQKDSLTYTVNGIEKTLLTPVLTKDSRMIAPIKVIAKELGVAYREDIVYNRILLERADVSVLGIYDQSGYTLRLDKLNNVTEVHLTVYSKKDAYPATFLFACYDISGKSVFLKIAEHTLWKGYNTYVINVDNLPEDIKTVKILNWSTTDHMIPIRDAISIE